MSSLFHKSKRAILVRLALGPLLILILALIGLLTQLSFLFNQHDNLVAEQKAAKTASELTLSLETQSRFWSDYLIHFGAANNQVRWDNFRLSERETLDIANKLLLLTQEGDTKDKLRHIIYSLEILRFSYQEARNSLLANVTSVTETAAQVREIDRVPSQLIMEVYGEIQNSANETSSTFWEKGVRLTLTLVLLLILTSLTYVRLNGAFTSRLLERQQRAQEQARWLLKHDYLTQLVNRKTFLGQLADEIEARNSFYLVNIKLSGIGQAGQTQGHSVQDGLIITAAQRIQGEMRPQDLLARSVGEEFLLRVCNDEPVNIGNYCQQILRRIEEEFVVDGYSHQLQAFAGVSFYPADASDTKSLMQCADIAAVYARRKRIRGPVSYSQRMTKEMQDKSRLIDELRIALESEQLAVNYQPQVDLKSSQVVGVEVLARLNSQNTDLNSPAVFIPLAEESGLIHLLGRKVAEIAIAQLGRWRGEGIDLRLAINVSPRQLEDPDFADVMLGLCAAAGVKSSAVDIEIIESDFIDGRHPLLKSLRASGFGLSIDDFGTGYSNLGYLSHFLPHQLKIDKTFVDEIESDERRHALVQSIVNLAHSQGIQVVAEGVENAVQASLLAEMGADIGQGYWFSRPLSALDMHEYLLYANRHSLTKSA